MPSWIFQICEISLADSVWKAQTHYPAKCRQNWSSVVETLQFFEFSKWPIIKIFRFFKMVVAAIFDCRIHKILLADSVRRAQAHHSTKFHQNRSCHCGDIAILQIFKMAAAAILDFWNREILLTIGDWVARRISMPNSVKTGQSVAKILRFFDFSRWRQLPSCIFEIVNFYLLPVSAGPWHIIVPNCVKIARSIAERLRFSNF